MRPVNIYLILHIKGHSNDYYNTYYYSYPTYGDYDTYYYQTYGDYYDYGGGKLGDILIYLTAYISITS